MENVHYKLFDICDDEIVKLMLDMSVETPKDIKGLKERFDKADKAELYALCMEHELDGVVGSAALKLGLSLPDFWLTHMEKEKKRLDFLKSKSIELCQIMSENGVPMVILKNGGIMLDMVDEAVKCPMEDIDSLVRKEDFLKAHELLIKNGFIFKFRSDYEKEQLDEAFRDGSTEYYIELPNDEKMWFELAWRAVAGRWIPPTLEPSTNDLFSRIHKAKGTEVGILSPEDNLLQVCIHTAKHSYVRAPGLRLHLDVERIVAHNDIDWGLFLEKVKKAHVRKATYLSLFIPSMLFNTPIPKTVLDEIKPKCANRMLKILGNAGLLHPKESKFSFFSFLYFQTMLYDNISDILRVINPGKQWMAERYNCKTTIERYYRMVLRFGDLIGIRKKK